MTPPLETWRGERSLSRFALAFKAVGLRPVLFFKTLQAIRSVECGGSTRQRDLRPVWVLTGEEIQLRQAEYNARQRLEVHGCL